jgi:hypothetical protein
VWAATIATLGTTALAEPQTRSSLPELLRVLGFAAAPGVFIALAAMPAVAPIVLVVVAAWMIAAAVVAVRQALDYRSTAPRRRGVRRRRGVVIRRGERRGIDLHEEGELMRLVLAVVAVIIGAGTAALVAGSMSWNRATGAAVELVTASTPSPAFDVAKLDQLPPPVLRYFQKVLPDRQPMIRSAIATQDAEFFINGAWRPLRATQHFRTSPPAFVWDAASTWCRSCRRSCAIRTSTAAVKCGRRCSAC